MRCPYACKAKTEYETNQYEYNEDGNPTTYKTVRQYVFQQEDCVKEECGAWYDGRCHYKDD